MVQDFGEPRIISDYCLVKMTTYGTSGTGTGVGAMYNRAGPEANPADTGRAFGNALTDMELSHRTRYADPSAGRGENMANGMEAPGHVNLSATQPVKYDVPTQYKENFVNKAAVRDAIQSETGKQVIRVDNIGDDEVEYLAQMKAQGELADFDRYVNTMIDPRQPGNLKWLMEIYPQFVDRRLKQVHTDYEFALRNQLIDSWGVNTFDDLHFKYLVDQGKIDGPELRRQKFADDAYAAGYLSPFHWEFMGVGDNRPKGLRLPFASAKTGKMPGDARGNEAMWELENTGRALGTGRTTDELSRGMQQKNIGRRPSILGMR